MDMQQVLDFLGRQTPNVKTQLGCGLLWDSLRQTGQNALYIENIDASKPLTVCVGKDAEAFKVKECVENWAREKGLV